MTEKAPMKLETLPIEISYYLYNFLDKKSLKNLSLTSKFFNVDTDYIKKTKLKKELLNYFNSEHIESFEYKKQITVFAFITKINNTVLLPAANTLKSHQPIDRTLLTNYLNTLTLLIKASAHEDFLLQYVEPIPIHSDSIGNEADNYEQSIALLNLFKTAITHHYFNLANHYLFTKIKPLLKINIYDSDILAKLLATLIRHCPAQDFELIYLPFLRQPGVSLITDSFYAASISNTNTASLTLIDLLNDDNFVKDTSEENFLEYYVFEYPLLIKAAQNSPAIFKVLQNLTHKLSVGTYLYLKIHHNQYAMDDYFSKTQQTKLEEQASKQLSSSKQLAKNYLIHLTRAKKLNDLKQLTSDKDFILANHFNIPLNQTFAERVADRAFYTHIIFDNTLATGDIELVDWWCLKKLAQLRDSITTDCTLQRVFYFHSINNVKLVYDRNFVLRQTLQSKNFAMFNYVLNLLNLPVKELINFLITYFRNPYSDNLYLCNFIGHLLILHLTTNAEENNIKDYQIFIEHYEIFNYFFAAIATWCNCFPQEYFEKLSHAQSFAQIKLIAQLVKCDTLMSDTQAIWEEAHQHAWERNYAPAVNMLNDDTPEISSHLRHI
ncbi:MAG: hypothetical protein Tsb005_13780 [Gammaproteobacteria bacterium]